MKKKCSKCRRDLPLTEFTKDSTSSDGVRYYCKLCSNEYHKQYRKGNEEKLKQQNMENYYKNKTHYNKQRKLRYKNNKQTELKKNREYKKENKDKINLINKKRRAKKEGVNENFTIKDKQYIMELFDNTCYNCGSTDNLCIDHHYPLSKGHALTRTNAVVLCRSCNSSKQDIIPEVFYTIKQIKILNEKLGI